MADAGDGIMALLPQPENHEPYSYVLYEEVESRYFPPPLPEGTLCWTLKSKGVKGSGGTQRAAELFSRARVVISPTEDDNDRVLVRYSKGSEYHVRRSNLIPVLEPTVLDGIVLVTGETPQYRRACVVHTYRESFLEVGCDFGITVHRVQQALLAGGTVARIAGVVDVPLKHEPRCLGIDRSPESICIATNRYPGGTFWLHNVLDDDDDDDDDNDDDDRFWGPVEKELGGPPGVVAIDINGNRELPAVLKCVDRVLNSGKEPPRLVIVKSRSLHAKLLEERKQQRRPTA